MTVMCENGDFHTVKLQIVLDFALFSGDVLAM